MQSFEEWGCAAQIVIVAPRRTIEHVTVARTFMQRFIGLLGRQRIDQDEGLLFVPGGSIHTCWMRFAIDVVFLSEQLEVLALAEHIEPWRFVHAPSGTSLVLELGANVARQVGIKRGELIYGLAKRDAPIRRSRRRSQRGDHQRRPPRSSHTPV